MNVMVTGGAGYIGSHTAVELLNDGHKVYIFDDLSNSSIKNIKIIENIAQKKVNFFKGTICSEDDLNNFFQKFNIDSVIHFAGLKSVEESYKIPEKYFEVNVEGSKKLFNNMKKNNVKKIIFSSSATIYGNKNLSPLTEDMSAEDSLSPYGQTKLKVESLLKELSIKNKDWSVFNLRYFNPIGAHDSGLLGESPKGKPTNIMPSILDSASNGKKFYIYGDSYPTFDGTCIRDYIHIVDLAKGHLKALKKTINTGVYNVNLGTGRGHSVKEILDCFQKINSLKINSVVTNKRKGDIPISFASVQNAKEVLNWEAKLSLEQMCRDSWRWKLMNLNNHQ